MDLEQCKNEYASLIVNGGICLKQGEKVLINSDVETADMARRVANECYRQGASIVEVRYSDSRLDAMDYAFASEEELEKVPKWLEERYVQQADELPCLIHLLSSDPIEFTDEMLSNQMKKRVAQLSVLQPIILRMQNKYKWTAVCIPTKAWADQVFPNEEDNLLHLWQDVLHTVLINGDGTSVEKWDDKWKFIWNHLDVLNQMSFQTLHFQTELGTDLTVELHPKAQFACASGREDGCVVNIPSEEIFTSPIAGKAEGKVVASCPLIYENQLIEGLVLTFADGKVASVKADKGELFMKQLIETDEGAKCLGEIAIVDKYSPVKELGHLLYHTLYDENAACHIAIGRGFPFVFKDYKKMNEEELNACQINQSGIHCDIMWGTDETCITGTTFDKQTIKIMEHGEWQI